MQFCKKRGVRVTLDVLRMRRIDVIVHPADGLRCLSNANLNYFYKQKFTFVDYKDYFGRFDFWEIFGKSGSDNFWIRKGLES